MAQQIGSPEKQANFGGEVQQEGEWRRIEAFVLARMHAEVMTDRQERFHDDYDRLDRQI